MGIQTWVGPQRVTKVDGPTLVSSNTITSLLQPQDKIVIPGGSIYVGLGIRAHILARISTVVTTPGTFTFTFRYGSTAIAASSAFTLTATAQTNDTLVADVNLTCRAEGSSGNFMFDGVVSSNVFANSFSSIFFGPGTVPVVGGNADLSVNGFIDLMGTWSVSNAANSITVHQFQLEFLG